ncbi:unnamed protein product [Gordionus sp. m RMFG-2023]
MKFSSPNQKDSFERGRSAICTTFAIDAEIPSREEIEEILKIHNDYRANVNPPARDMAELKWTSEGASRADAMTRRCNTNHDMDQERLIYNYSDAGQNIHWNSQMDTWKDAIKDWYDEVKDFQYGVDNGGYVLHYTQLVWGATKEIGCSKTQCPRLNIYTCNYYPKGNSPYYEPYERSNVQSCDGCLKGGVCSTGAYAGKLLKECDEFCVNHYTNCNFLADTEGYCSGKNSDKCVKSCNPKCKPGIKRDQNNEYKDQNKEYNDQNKGKDYVKCVDYDSLTCKRIVNEGDCSNYMQHCVKSCNPACKSGNNMS